MDSKKALSAWLVFLLFSNLWGCSHRPQKSYIDIAGFKDVYEKAWIKDDQFPYNRRLVQLGIPTKDTIVLWYTLSKEEKYKLNGRISLDEKSVSQLAEDLLNQLFDKDKNHPKYAYFKDIKKEQLEKRFKQLELKADQITALRDLWETSIKQRSIQIKVDGKPIAKDPEKVYFRHFPFNEYGSGRIEIRNLGAPDHLYTILLKLFDDDRETSLAAWTAPDPKKTKSFSFLAYSCLQPYSYKKRRKENLIFKQTVHVLNIMKERAILRIKSPDKAPSFALGLGDQIYIDPGAHKDNPYALIWGKNADTMRYYDDDQNQWSDPNEYFDEVYRRHLALPPFDEAHLYLPSAMMWDDHEIRDGWGSQRDENDRRYFFGDYVWGKHIKAARKAAFAYEFLRNPGLGSLTWNDLEGKEKDSEIDRQTLEKIFESPEPTNSQELYFQFEWANVAFFMMDLRSQRNYDNHKVISNEQFDVIKAWLGSYPKEESKLFVLGSSVPVSIGLNPFGKILKSAAGMFQEKIDQDDDLRDQWYANRTEKKRLLDILIEHFEAHEKHHLLILSGDIHNSQVHYLILKKNGVKRVFGHEVVSSALAQEKFISDESIIKGEKKKKIRFYSKEAEKIVEPNFAEIFIEEKGANQPPAVKVIFYPAKDGKRLVNLYKQPPFTQEGFITLDYNYNKHLKLNHKSIDRFLPNPKPWGNPDDRANSWRWPLDQ